jgi:DNA gyrase subunit B
VTSAAPFDATPPAVLPRTETHDWSSLVDPAHLADVQARAAELGGYAHLLLEVLAYPAEEAAENGGGTCTVTLHADGSVAVADGGRGTAVVRDVDGRVVRKPVMATRDVRFFAAEDAPLLPDGRPRRGMSVVAALSSRLEHTNRRAEGAWTQAYAHGIPESDLVELPADGTTGTTVLLRADPALVAVEPVTAEDLRAWADAWPTLAVRVVDERHP